MFDINFYYDIKYFRRICSTIISFTLKLTKHVIFQCLRLYVRRIQWSNKNAIAITEDLMNLNQLWKTFCESNGGLRLKVHLHFVYIFKKADNTHIIKHKIFDQWLSHGHNSWPEFVDFTYIYRHLTFKNLFANNIPFNLFKGLRQGITYTLHHFHH